MRNSVPLVIAVVLGIVSMLAVYSVMQKQKQSARQVPVKVAMARTSLTPGTLFSREHFRWYEIPKSIYDRLEEEFISPTEMEDYLDKRRIQRVVPENSFILKSYFVGRTGLAATTIERRISGQQRAVSLSVGYVEGLAGLLRVGDHVDIIGIFELNMGSAGTYQVSSYILTDVPILALDSYTEMTYTQGGRKLSQYATVTVRVPDPVQALFLIHSHNIASKFYLVLRRKDDPNTVEVPPVDNKDLVEKLNMRIRNSPMFRELWNW